MAFKTDNNLAYIDKKTWSELVRKLHNSNDLIVFNLLVIILAEYHSTNKLEIKISKQDLRERLGIKDNNLIERVFKATMVLRSTLIRYEDEIDLEAIPLVESCPIKKRDSSLLIKIDKRFEPFLKDLEIFIKMRQCIARCKPSAVLLYSFLKVKHDHKLNPIHWKVINDYCHLNYNDYSGFKQRFLEPTIKSIKDLTNIIITFKEFKHGKKVIGLTFNLIDSKDVISGDILNGLEQSVTESSQLTIDPPAKPAKKEPFEDEIREIFDYYLIVFNRSSSYEYSTKRKNLIRARLKEGHSVETCKKHIDLHSQSDWHMGRHEKNNTPYIEINHVFESRFFDPRSYKIEHLEGNKTSSPASIQALKKHNIANNMPEDTPIDHYLTEYTKTHPFLNRGLNEEEYSIVGQKWKKSEARWQNRTFTWCDWSIQAQKSGLSTTFKIPTDYKDINALRDKYQYAWEKHNQR
jgi:uncharacterized phage protein (TIGR02220 family)